MQEPNYNRVQELEQQKIKANDEAEEYIDNTGDMTGGLDWRDAVHEEIDHEIKKLKQW